MTVFDYVAFAAMGIVFVFLIWAVIWLGDMPAGIAKKPAAPAADLPAPSFQSPSGSASGPARAS